MNEHNGTSRWWVLHPGDWVFLTPSHGGLFREIGRSANELEAQQMLKTFQTQNLTVIVTQVKGTV